MGVAGAGPFAVAANEFHIFHAVDDNMDEQDLV